MPLCIIQQDSHLFMTLLQICIPLMTPVRMRHYRHHCSAVPICSSCPPGKSLSDTWLCVSLTPPDDCKHHLQLSMPMHAAHVDGWQPSSTQ